VISGANAIAMRYPSSDAVAPRSDHKLAEGESESRRAHGELDLGWCRIQIALHLREGRQVEIDRQRTQHGEKSKDDHKPRGHARRRADGLGS